MRFEIASGLSENKPRKKRAPRKSIYDRQREEETVRNATNRGYLRRMTVEFLNDNVGLDDCDLPTVGYLNVTSQQLSSLGALEMCVSLRICILPGNYITDFDALGGCRNLWALDLHGNQIKKVPGPKFWSTLNQLQIVLLHDNGISKLETIHHLCSSSSLLILSMYDTPLSLKKNYRHHVVNGIWSLKALDGHVISDEEIIEDCNMPSKFAALQKNFKIDLNHTLTKESTIQEAVKQMEELKTKVNKIQAKYSPVLLIQKTFRMHAIRKRYKHLMATRVWAATSIQRFYRFYKGITKSLHEVLPPPTSPFNPPGYGTHLDYYGSHIHNGESEDDSGELNKYDSGSSRKTKDSSSIHVPLGGNDGLGSDIRSKTLLERGELRYVSSVIIGEQSSYEQSYQGSIGERISGNEVPVEGQKKVTRRMTIDLVKLEASAIGTIQSATCELAVDSSLGLDKRSKTSKESKSKTSVKAEDGDVILLEQRKRDENEKDEALYKRRLKPEMIGKYRTVRVFLGQVVKPKAKAILTDSVEDETAGFRLLGEEPPKQKNEPIAEMLLSKKEMGENVRKSLRQFRRERWEKRKTETGGVMKLTNDQRLFLHTHGTMRLACLRAVYQAYGDRARAQRQVELSERVCGMKERRELVSERLQSLKQEYQENILRERIRDGVRIADSLRENEQKHREERRRFSERRTAAVVDERMRQSDFAFARNFTCQQNSVSEALRQHDITEVKKEKLKKKQGTVQKERQNNLQKQDLVKKYMEHRRLMSQAQMSKAKAEINTRLVDEANKQFMEMETNMKRAKTKQSKVNEYYSLPPLNAPKHNTQLAVLSPAKVQQWEECLPRDGRLIDDGFTESDFCSDIC